MPKFVYTNDISLITVFITCPHVLLDSYINSTLPILFMVLVNNVNARSRGRGKPYFKINAIVHYVGAKLYVMSL